MIIGQKNVDVSKSRYAITGDAIAHVSLLSSCVKQSAAIVIMVLNAIQEPQDLVRYQDNVTKMLYPNTIYSIGY